MHTFANFHTVLAKIENGYLTPSIDIVQRMMKVFVVIEDQLLNDKQYSVVEIQNSEPRTKQATSTYKPIG